MAGDLVRVMQWQGRCFGRLWTAIDILNILVLVAIHGLALLVPFHFSWSACWTAPVLSHVTGLGLKLSYHKNLAHRSFKLSRWLEYSFAYCGVLSLLGSPIEWVSSHRSHHQFSDTSSDPHTPVKGLWYSRSYRIDELAKLLKNVGDLKKQWYYRFLHYTCIFHTVFLGAVLYAVGGLPFIVWGLGVRLVYVYHVTFSINSICHIWGKQVWDTGDSSKNNWLFGLLVLQGEGWHNNRHTFEYSARQGLEWWQIDVTWYVIRLIKLPTETQKKRKALCNQVKEGSKLE